MNENRNSRSTIQVTEGVIPQTTSPGQDGHRSKFERLKKPLIFGLMGIVFVGCLYLILKPAKDKKATVDLGLNNTVPQPSDAELPTDKQKAYEQDQLEQSKQQKRNALISLSDYWAEDMRKDSAKEHLGPDEIQSQNKNALSSDQALKDYRSTQSTLGSFYNNAPSETEELKRQIKDLKEQMQQRDETPAHSVEGQLALMEKSYQMAAKYLPATGNSIVEANKPVHQQISETNAGQKDTMTMLPLSPSEVSALERETDVEIEDGRVRNQDFFTASGPTKEQQQKNSIRAVIQQTQVVSGEGMIHLRLSESAKISGTIIPRGTTLTAIAKIQPNRIQIQVLSIEHGGSILPVMLTVYDLNGQQGLQIPFSPERNALTEIAANMSQQSGSSLMLSRSAGQQIAADLSRGVVQGVSNYTAKKVRIPRVTLKAGHEVFLVSKK
jgi:conjugative transposon TraM protein